MLDAKGDYAAAEPLYREALAMKRKLLGNEHLSVANSSNNLAVLLVQKGDYTAAEPLLREALAMHRKLLGDEHPNVANILHNLAALLRDKGDYAAAEPLYREALAMHRKLLGDEHPEVANILHNLASLLQAKGDYATAEPLYREALAVAEGQRVKIVGGERERGIFAGALRLPAMGAALALVEAKLGRANDALDVLERSRGRAVLDLLSRSDRDLVVLTRAKGAEAAERLDRALSAEQAVQVAVSTIEASLAATQKRKDLSGDEKRKLLDEQQAAVKESRRKLADANTAVFAQLRQVWLDAQPAMAEQIRSALATNELLLSYSFSSEALLLLAAPPSGSGDIRSFVLAEGKEKIRDATELIARVRRFAAEHGAFNVADAQQLRDLLVPEALRREAWSARRLVIIPDGVLHGIPWEMLPLVGGSDDKDDLLAGGPQLVYADSGTIYRNRRAEAKSKHFASAPVSALILGDPIFERETTKPSYPQEGVLVAMVAEGSNGASAGLRRGDVIVSYDGQTTADYDALVKALGGLGKRLEAGERKPDERIALTYWREGRTEETNVAPGKLGVQLDRSSPAQGLAYLAMASRGMDEKTAEASALDQVRLHGGVLAPLPGTRREAHAIAQAIKESHGDAALLLGEEAKLSALESGVAGKRFVHLATHGLTGSSERPYDASLALTQPSVYAPEDIGFLTLDQLIRGWRGKLSDCELVVLSACDTQRGVKSGDSVMTLPWGFFYAGTPTVVASLWKVDDTATALLMTRFYENLLGKYDESRQAPGRSYALGEVMTKADALREAKLWLRSLTEPQLRRRLEITDDQEWQSVMTGLRGLDVGRTVQETMPGVRVESRPFNHPHFWAAFVLLGDPG